MQNISQSEVKNHILKALNLVHRTGDVVELRILNTGKTGTVSGYFDDFNELAGRALNWSGKAPAIYVTLNPVNPALLARASNKVVGNAKTTTSDQDIVRRVWFPVDLDPVRPGGISSTDVEHQGALDRACKVRAWLKEHGWPEPIYADSGNGAHLLFPIDMPNDNESRELVKRCLLVLDGLFSDDQVQVDTTTYNAARIWKLYGTLAAKGDNTPDRPHRMAMILEAPEVVDP
jgi:hypothetical protein